MECSFNRHLCYGRLRFFFFFFNAETIVQAIVRIVRNGCKNLLHTEAVISSQPVVKDRVKVFSVKVGSRG
jgi:hypothetical protein